MSLLATAGIACAAIYMVLNATPPAERKVDVKPPSRSLAYENAIAQSPASKPDGENAEPETTSAAPSVAAAEPQAAPEPEAPAAPAPAPKAADSTAAAGQDATMPPAEDDGANGQGYEPLPWQQHAARPDPGQADYPNYPDNGAAPGQDANGYGQDGQPQGQDPYGQANADPYGQPPQGQDPYGQPPADPYGNQANGDPNGQPPADPYGNQANADPNGAAPQGQGQGGEEWVQVQISGSAMRSGASDDAPMLFAFPYGRNLRVVSRNGDWVQVADPKSAATGWMQAYALAPSAGPAPAGYNQAYDPNQDYQEEQQPRRRPFGKGGFADMINRAFGGHD